MSFGPKFVGNGQRLNAELRPPADFIAGLVQIAMVRAAERHGVLIADLQAQTSGLCEAQMMGVRRLTPTNDTGL